METQAQRDYLLTQSCDAQQGMLECAPLPAPDFEAWLQQRAAAASWRAAA